MAGSYTNIFHRFREWCLETLGSTWGALLVIVVFSLVCAAVTFLVLS